MRLTELATRLARLEASGGRLAAARTVAQLLGRASNGERAPITYLLQGRLRPAYDPLELGVGERVSLRALARAYTTTEPDVGRQYRRSGDLGQVAESPRLSAKSSRCTARRHALRRREGRQPPRRARSRSP